MSLVPVRPTNEDDDALALLLANDRLAPWAAQFVESLGNWEGPWTPKQAEKFDEVCEEYGQ